MRRAFLTPVPVVVARPDALALDDLLLRAWAHLSDADIRRQMAAQAGLQGATARSRRRRVLALRQEAGACA